MLCPPTFIPTFLSISFDKFFAEIQKHTMMKDAVTEQFWLRFKTRLFTVNECTLDAKQGSVCLSVCLLSVSCTPVDSSVVEIFSISISINVTLLCLYY